MRKMSDSEIERSFSHDVPVVRRYGYISDARNAAVNGKVLTFFVEEVLIRCDLRSILLQAYRICLLWL